MPMPMQAPKARKRYLARNTLERKVQRARMAARINAFTVDVEDWFQVAAFAPVIDRRSWDTLPCRVEANVDRLLTLLAQHRIQGTFFTLGWIAERYPALVRQIAAGGHEVASHGYGHRFAADQTPDEFRDDLTRAKDILESLIGREVIGYRAPSFSVGKRNPWAHQIMADTGHLYSSSVFPVQHDLYGTPDAPRLPYTTPSGIVEIPPTTLRLFGRNLPAAGGGYFRLLPYKLNALAIHRMNRLDLSPAVFYCHPWEIDTGQPRVENAGWKSRLRHYTNLDKTITRIERLLVEFEWSTMRDVFTGRIADARKRASQPGPDFGWTPASVGA